MLTYLSIKNLALIEQVEWSLGQGLLAVTGETGAGKSVLIKALKLLLGDRADKTLIRHGSEQAKVEAIFQLDASKLGLVNQILDDFGLDVLDVDDGAELIIRRQVSESSSRQWINQSVVTVQALKQLGEQLVDLHGAHEQQSLFSNDKQRTYLDAYLQQQALLKSYEQAYQQWRLAVQSFEELQQSEQASSQELELLEHQFTEISSAEINIEQELALEQQYQRASSSVKLLELSSQAAACFEAQPDSASLTDLLEILQRKASEIERLDEACEIFIELPAVQESLQMMQQEISRYVEDLDLDQSAFEALEQRINLLESLKRKYGPSLEDVEAYGIKIQEKLSTIGNRDEALAKLEQQVDSCRVALDQLGQQLTQKRADGAQLLAKTIVRHLQELGFLKSEFNIELKPLEQPSATGLESIEFNFSPNPGEPSKPLKLVASSGEMSRVMLAIKAALAEQDSVPLLVFDEIDANVGGSIATQVGEKMKQISANHQVITITHFPQVAAQAQQHFGVSKSMEGDRVVSTIQELSGEARLTELMRMLGGESSEVRALAQRLIQN